MLIALALAACTPPTPAERLAACTDLACQQAALVEVAAADPLAARRFVTGVQDPLDQVALVTTLGGLDPALLDQLCDGLQEAARQRCRRFVLRPHLGDPGRPVVLEVPRMGGGPRDRLLPVPAALAPQPEEVAVRNAAAACSDDPDCRRDRARAAARAGDAAGAEAACRGHEKAEDCRFSAAESAVAALGRAGLSVAVPLCAAAPHPSGCLTHAATLATPPACPADAVDPAAVAELEATTAALGAALGQAHLGELAAGYVRTQWIEAAVAAAAQPTGDLLDHLPPEATVHVRASLARRLVVEDHSPDLDAQTRRLEAALAARSGQGPTARRVPVVSQGVPYYLWPFDLVGEEILPAAYSLADTRRPVSEDAHVDAQLAVLEALAAHQPVPPSSFWVGVLADPDRSSIVRWSAARIVSGLDPEALRSWSGEADHPLVALRVDAARESAPPPVLPPPAERPKVRPGHSRPEGRP